MFGKRKDEKEVYERLEKTNSALNLRNVLEESNAFHATGTLTGCGGTTGSVRLGYTPVSPYTTYTASLSETRITDTLLKLYGNLATAVMNVLEPEAAVAQLINVLENIKCPTDDCRACPYHIPGSVEHCDKNRFFSRVFGVQRLYKSKQT